MFILMVLFFKFAEVYEGRQQLTYEYNVHILVGKLQYNNNHNDEDL